MLIDTTYAALFIDYENMYFYLKNNLTEQGDPQDAVTQIIRSLRSTLLSEYMERAIVHHAYADYDKIGENAQGALYLLGVETHNVLGTDHKNAADMRLCIDALETLYTRPEIRSFVFLAGDRDYIPVINHLKKHARTVRVVAFQGNMSGDLLANVGDEFFLSGESLLPEEFKLAKPKETLKEVARALVPTLDGGEERVMPTPPRRLKISKLEGDGEREALEILLSEFGHHTDVWVTPFLHRLRTSMPLLAEYERKVLITHLEDAGAIWIEKRPGNPHDYSVIVINWNHPDVRDLNP